VSVLAGLQYVIQPTVRGTAIRATEQATTRLRSGIRATQQADRSLNTELNRTNSRSIQRATNATDRLRDGFRGARHENESLNDELRESDQEAGDLVNTIKNLAIGAAVIGGVKKATQTFIGFEDVMLRVRSLVGEAGEDQFPVLVKQAKLLGSTTAFAAREVGTAQANLAQTGFKVNEIYSATPAVLRLASAATLDMGRSSEILSKSLRLFNLEADQSVRVSDVIAKAQASSAADANFLASALFNVGSNANAMGFDIEDTTALIAAISTGFDNGSAAGTALNATLRDMAKNADQLERMGVKVADANGNFRQLEDVIMDFDKATSHMTATQRKFTTAQVFGEFAQKAVNVLLAEGAEKTVEYNKELRKATETSKMMAKIMESGLGGTIRSLLSATEGLAIEVGDFLNPAIDAGAKIITGTILVGTKFLNFLNSGSIAADVLTSAIWGVTAAYGAYKATALAATLQTALLSSGITFATLTSGGLTAALTLLNLTNPFGWVAIGITGLTLLYKKFKPFRDLVQKGTSFVKGIFGFGNKENNLEDNSSITQNSRLENKTINNINNKKSSSNVNITIPVNNNIESKKLGKAVEKAANKAVQDYNNDTLAALGGA